MRLGPTLLALALSAVGPADVVVRPGETLAQVARRTLGEEGAASELKAINKLSGDSVAEGTALKLPGPERAVAANALKTAHASVTQARVPEPRRHEAEAKLKQAQELFSQARYTEATLAADAAWLVVSADKAKDTRFSVDVAKDGQTRVKAVSGAPVRVDAQDVSQRVGVGQELRVEKGQPPQMPEPLLAPPALKSPDDGKKLERGATKRGLGPVELAWGEGRGASAYEVVLTPDKGAVLVMTAPGPELKLPPLPEGHYRWAVRSVAEDGQRSELSSPRAFYLRRDLSISAQQTPWK